MTTSSEITKIFACVRSPN